MTTEGMSETPIALQELCIFLETKCACQPDETTEDGIIECEPCAWVGAIQLLVAQNGNAGRELAEAKRERDEWKKTAEGEIAVAGERFKAILRLEGELARREGWRELADDLLEDLELHGLHDDPSWNYRRQKAEFKRLDAALAACPE